MRQPDSNAPASGLILALIVFLCVLMIGATGYMKHQLNRSEGLLANPERLFGADETVYDRLLTNLGYGGFLSAARKFTETREKSHLIAMKDNLDTARESFDNSAEQLPPGRRRDVQAILDNYSDFAARAAASLNDPATQFGAEQLLPLVMSLSTLDSRLQNALAGQRLEAQSATGAWSLGLMLVAWISLVLAAATAVVAYLIIHNRQSVPLRALAQCVENMAKGDLQTPIWGTERKDTIGELARHLNLARLHFGKLPDITVMADQGPLQIKFDGETKSLFDAMMRNMADDYERARREISELSQTTGKQHAIIEGLYSQLETALAQIKEHGLRSDQALQSVTRSISDSAANLISTQEKTAIQINRMVPYMQDRAQKLVDVTAYAGTQVATTLQSLLQSSLDLKQSVSHSQQNVQQLATDTGSIAERIFAALNLLQASSKLLGETTDSTQSRLNEALDSLGKGSTGLHQLIERSESRMLATARAEEVMAGLVESTTGSAQQLEQVVKAIMEREASLRSQLDGTSERLTQMTSTFGSVQSTLDNMVQKITGDSTTVTEIVSELRRQNEQLVSTLKDNAQASHSSVQQLAERSNYLLQRLEEQVVHQAKAVESQITTLTRDSSRLAEQGTNTGAQLAKLAESLAAEQNRYEDMRRTFGDRLNSVGQKIEQQAAETLSRTESLTTQGFAKLATVSENAEGILQRLGILGQLTSTLGTVAGQLGQLVPALSQMPQASSGDAHAAMGAVSRELEQQWQQSLHEIEAMHDSLAQIIVQQKDQLETRLGVIDAKLKTAIAQAGGDAQQTAIMNEIVMALGKINDHVLQLDEVVHELKRG